MRFVDSPEWSVAKEFGGGGVSSSFLSFRFEAAARSDFWFLYVCPAFTWSDGGRPPAALG